MGDEALQEPHLLSVPSGIERTILGSGFLRAPLPKIHLDDQPKEIMNSLDPLRKTRVSQPP